METWVEEIEDWDARSVAGGYAGLRDLADREFSGAVSTGATWLFMVNGRVVGVVEYRQTATGDEVRDADVEAFEDAEATAYTAPDPSVPLLVAMKTADGETRAKYYTEDTPVEEVHETLSDGGFTGYLELSENVLSGDYYLVYQGGRASELAFVGNARRLFTGDEAYDRTVDEVGIYEVTAVDLDVVDVPEPAAEDEDSDAAAAAAGASAGVAAGEATDAEDVDAGTGDAGSEAGAADAAGADAGPTDASAADAGAPGAGAGDESTPGTDGSATAAQAETDDPASGEQAAGASSDAAPGDADDVGATASGSAASGESGPAEAETGTDPRPPTDGETSGERAGDSRADEPSDGEAADESGSREEPRAADAADAGSAETGSTPAEATAATDDSAAGADARGQSSGVSAGNERAGGSAGHETRPSSRDGATSDRATSGTATTGDRRSSSGSSNAGAGANAATDSLVNRSIPSLDPDRTGTGDGGDRQDRAGAESQQRTRQRARSAERRTDDRRTDERRERAEAAPELEEELEEAKATLSELREERDRLREQRDDLKERVETLQERVADLEAEVEAARTAAAEAGAATGDGPSLSVAEAFAGTNLFVRYRSKGELTLEDVHDGKGEPGDLASNLELEHHTQFEDEHASVAGQQFEEWLHDTQRYRFVRWLVGELLFEIRDTGAADAMRDLYDALPEIDRVELDASVEVETQEGAEDRSFDLVARDRMGQPLVVADLDSSRDPVSEGAMASLVESGTQACSTEETFSGAFFVASSFFDPDALETAREATSDSLLSRDKRKSFVKLSRKRGFHLGLVEARDGSFHLSVPDL
jgi:hypothetical protein